MFQASVSRQKKEEEVLKLGASWNGRLWNRAMRLSEGNVTRAAEYLALLASPCTGNLKNWAYETIFIDCGTAHHRHSLPFGRRLSAGGCRTVVQCTDGFFDIAGDCRSSVPPADDAVRMMRHLAESLRYDDMTAVVPFSLQEPVYGGYGGRAFRSDEEFPYPRAGTQ